MILWKGGQETRLAAWMVLWMVSSLLLSASAWALSLGSLQQQEGGSIPAGGEGSFSILLWNREGDPYPVALQVQEAPPGWEVVIEPARLTLGGEDGGEALSLPDGVVVHPRTVTVRIAVPRDAPQEEGTVVVQAVAGEPAAEIAVLQERVFRFQVTVTEPGPSGVGWFSPGWEGAVGEAASGGLPWGVGAVALVLLYLVWRWRRA